MSSIDPNSINSKELDVASYHDRDKLREGVKEFVDKIKSDKDERVKKANQNFRDYIKGK